MSSVTLYQPFDTRMFTLTSGSPVVAVFGGGTTVILSLSNGIELEFIGSDLTMDGTTPISGSVTRINAYAVVDGVSTLAADLRPNTSMGLTFSLQGLVDGLAGEANGFSGSTGFDRIVGGNQQDQCDPMAGDDELSLGGGDDLVFLRPDPGNPLPSAMVYDGGDGFDQLFSISSGTGTYDLRRITLISVERIDIAAFDAVFSSRQLGSPTGLAGVTDFNGASAAEFRVMQNTRVADMGAVSGSTGPSWRLIGRELADVQRGSDNLTLTMQGRGGNDTMRGGDALETLEGGLGNDLISGGAGNDVLTGGKGADRLTGGTGNDAMTGDAGRDTFVFAIGDGTDTISGFQAFGPASDRIDLRAVTGITGLTDLMRNHLVVQDADLLLQLGSGGRFC